MIYRNTFTPHPFYAIMVLNSGTGVCRIICCAFNPTAGRPANSLIHSFFLYRNRERVTRYRNMIHLSKKSAINWRFLHIMYWSPSSRRSVWNPDFSFSPARLQWLRSVRISPAPKPCLVPDTRVERGFATSQCPNNTSHSP